MRRGNERCPLVWARYRFCIGAQLERKLHKGKVITHGGDRHNVVLLGIERARIGTGLQQNASDLAMAEVRGDVEWAALVSIGHVWLNARRECLPRCCDVPPGDRKSTR